MKKFFLLFAAALLTTATAWADWNGGTYTATVNEQIDGTINVSTATLTINEGVTVTVNGGVVISDSLTITGSGTLVVNGRNGDIIAGNAFDGNVIVNGATVRATGGNGDDGAKGDDGANGHDEDGSLPATAGYPGHEGSAGGFAGHAFAGQVTLISGSITAIGGNGGKGGDGGNGGNGGSCSGKKGASGGNGGNGGKGNNGGYAFRGILVFYGGTVNAAGGAGGGGSKGGTAGLGGAGNPKGDDGGSGVDGAAGNASDAFNNIVNYKTATYTQKGGDSENPTEDVSSALNHRYVTLTAPDAVIGDDNTNASEQTNISYVNRTWDETNKTVVETALFASAYDLSAEKSDTIGGDKFYYASGNVVLDKVLIVDGTASIILCDGAKLSCDRIQVENNDTLHIYDQTAGTGQLEITNVSIKSFTDPAPAIGCTNENGGDVFFHGGNITLQGPGKASAWYGAPAIGGNRYALHSINIYAGTVNATGGEGAAGIGTGIEKDYHDSYGYGTINIYGGTVNAVAGEPAEIARPNGGAGIGGGRGCGAGGQVNIYGGTVNAQGSRRAAGIGSGANFDRSSNPGVISIYGGTVTARGGLYGAGIGGGNEQDNNTVLIAGGTVYAYGYAEDTKSSWEDGHGAGIGGGDGAHGGTITITGGEVHAYGAKYAAGIGGGMNGHGATTTISGGKVYAYGGTDAAGIGSGETSFWSTARRSGVITISGGDVHAYGFNEAYQSYSNSEGAGIGCGEDGKVESIDIQNGAKVYAVGGGKSYAIGTQHADDHGLSKITLGVEQKVRVQQGSVLIAGNEWNKICLEHDIEITPCDHSHAAWSYTGTTENDTHTLVSCPYCRIAGVTSKHDFHDSLCICGAHQTKAWVTVNFYKASGKPDEPDGAYMDVTISSEHPEDSVFMPTVTTAPAGLKFAGWLQSDTKPASYMMTAAETLLPVGKGILAAHTDMNFYARYEALNIALQDENDNSAVLTQHNGSTANSLSLNGRTFYCDGSWNILCLPFDVANFEETPLQGATVKTLSASSFDEQTGVLTLTFGNDLNAIEEGKPYIVKWTAGSEISNPSFANTAIKNVDNDVETEVVDFVGVFSPVTLEAGDTTVCYLGEDGELHYPDDEMTINSGRGYFDLKGIELSKVTSIVLQFDEAEAIEITNASANTLKIILNGQVFILRGDNIYTITGAEVK